MIGRRLKKAAMIAVLSVGVTAGSIASYCGAVVWSGNFHSVEEGQVYRSAQLDKADLESVIAAHGIKSILNLRGVNKGSSWYQDEIATSHAHGVTHYDIGLSARRRVTREEMQKLVETIRAAPKPLLVHCMSGADRTGLVSALYRYSIEGTSADDAAAELSLRYGHFPWLTSKTNAMDESFRAWLELPPTAEGG